MIMTNQVWTLLINQTSHDLIFSGIAKCQISVRYNDVKNLRSLCHYFAKLIKADYCEVTLSELKKPQTNNPL